MTSLVSAPNLTFFEDLKQYSRADVVLSNTFGDLFRTGANWELWVQEGLGALLEVTGERTVLLEQSSEIEPNQIQNLSFQKDEVRIGRDPSNDVVIGLAGVGRQHSRIRKQEARYLLHDLGSANGTYLNGSKLDPNEPAALTEGAQFLIFPYRFTFSTRQVSRQPEPIRVAAGVTRISSWDARRSDSFRGMEFYSVKVSPDLGSAVLGISRGFLKTLVKRASQAEASTLANGEAGVVPSLLLSVLERANRDLKFPVHFSLQAFEGLPHDTRGVSVECVVGVTGGAGVVELFLPAALVEAMRLSSHNQRSGTLPVSWPLTFTTAFTDLSVTELGGLEPGDILLTTARNELLLPSTRKAFHHGWRVELAQSDPPRLKIESYFEGTDLTMDTQAGIPESEGIEKPDLGTLPVRVHVVLSQLEMTLAELNRLQPGSIIELDRGKSETVQLALNGKLAGSGELVEIEGRLGVRISSWIGQ